MHGLSKVPYLRDSRRSQFGIFKFRLNSNDLSIPYEHEDGNLTARPFLDTIGLGYYPYADIHHLSDDICHYPHYISGTNKPLLPYYIPFRALTNMEVENLLVSGKSMSQTFLANAGTRLHPPEWASGVGAGAAATLMVEQDWSSTAEVYDNINLLQELLLSESIASPLEWTF